jgi:hypothetical protein
VVERPFSHASLLRGSWLVILHADRVPPHAGMIFNGSYNSLTVKTREINVSTEVLYKTISQKKIKTIFIKLKDHPVFSVSHQLEIFQYHLSNFSSVKPFEATCLSPVKLFLNDFFSFSFQANDLIYNVVFQLSANGFIDYCCALNMDLDENIKLPFYTTEELNEIIKKEHNQIQKDVSKK